MYMDEIKDVQFMLMLSESMKERIVEQAAKEGISASRLIRRAVEMYLISRPKQ